MNFLFNMVGRFNINRINKNLNEVDDIVDNAIQLESGDFLLMENGEYLILE